MNNEYSIMPEDTATLLLNIELTHEKIMDKLSLDIREKRDIRKWSQDILSEKTPVSRATLINTEMGRGNPSLKTILSIAMTMGYSLKIDLVRL